MIKKHPLLSTGIPTLDDILQYIIPGDNIVWQVDSIHEYIPFLKSFAAHTIQKGHKLIYFRFAGHQQLLTDTQGIEQHFINPTVGFETFTAEIHKVITIAGKGAFFVFDCLSDLPVHWYSDLMLGNFFMITCPYVLNMESLAYFAIIRYRHSLPVAASIRDTTQILIDAYRYKDNLYVHPMKVLDRYSPTMYLPHVWKGDTMQPVVDSATVSELVSDVKAKGLDSSTRILDIWDRTLMKIQELLDDIEQGKRPENDAIPIFEKLLRMIVSRDERVLKLASKNLNISDILEIKKRLIGTGLIGGKSVGMLIARAILRKMDERLNNLLEIHDSFYIGSDVFYTYTVLNDCWRIKQNQRNPDTFLEGIDEARERMLSGRFPEFITEQFVEMFDYFGQSPIIVRSSSLLEDNFGNAFSGKYESIFCVNQGTRSDRISTFMSAVRHVYASTMNREALMYRAQRGLLDRDEQMALLVQRVSGSVYGNLFFPQISGVGLSFNPYVWNEKIDAESGVLRIVCGLGTRAVERHDDDYTRIVALNAPELHPAGNDEEQREYAQSHVDVLDLQKNSFVSMKFEEIPKISSDFPVEIVASSLTRESEHFPSESQILILTFEKLLTHTAFVNDMKNMLKTLQKEYDYPVDIEFTVNFRSDESYRINLVQCRPLQITGSGRIVKPPENIVEEDIIIETHGAIIGPSMAAYIDRIIYIVPSIYGNMREHEKYSVARLVGRLTHLEKDALKVIMLVGPGRWGTTIPSLGVPVRFADINTVSVLCEIVEMHENLVPDLSLGTHFFNDMVEAKMLYLAIFPHVKKNKLRKEFLEQSPNKLPDLLPAEANYSDAVRVIDTIDIPGNRMIILNANTVEQTALCYLNDR